MAASPRPTVSPSAARDRAFTNTLERGLRVLACFSGSRPELGNGEIAAATGLPKATVSRLTHTLLQLGYLRRQRDSALFELGPAVLTLGYPVLAGLLRWRRLALPHLAELARAIDGVATVLARDRLQMVTIDSVAERDVLQRNPGPGLTLDFAVATPGIAWLIGATAEERDRAWRELVHGQPLRLDAMRSAFEVCQEQFRRDGWIARYGAVRPDTLVLAAPLKRAPGRGLLVLSCALVTPLAQVARLSRLTGPKLLGTARAIAAAQGKG